MSEHQLVVTIGAEDLDPGQGGAVWVRLEPIASQGEVATVARTAALLDEIFQIEPCGSGLGAGGEEDLNEDGLVDPPVTPQEFNAATVKHMELNVCRAADAGWSWEARVRVLRSHLERPYVLRCDPGDIVSTERIEDEVTTAVLFAGAQPDQKTHRAVVQTIHDQLCRRRVAGRGDNGFVRLQPA